MRHRVLRHRAWCRPTGTARRPTTAASCGRCDARGHRVTFYEPDAYEPPGAPRHRGSAVGARWSSIRRRPRRRVGRARAARGADLIVKASGVGVFDELLEARGARTLAVRQPGGVLGRGRAGDARPRACTNPRDPFRALIPRYDVVFTYGGGEPVVAAYTALGARAVRADLQRARPGDAHPGAARSAIRGRPRLSRQPPARPRGARRGVLLQGRGAAAASAASCWAAPAGATSRCRRNVRYVGHVYTRDHNAFNCTPRAVLNVSRESMARYGFSPATRVFEAAGAGACLITDAWEGIELFLEPGEEVLVARRRRRSGGACCESLTPERARGDRARRRAGACWRSTRTRIAPRRWKRCSKAKLARERGR